MFTLNKVIARDSATDLDDIAKIKRAMKGLGYYDDSDTGYSPYPDKRLFHSIQAFQKDNDLKTDGVIKPEGPTHETIKKELAKQSKSGNVFSDFIRNRKDMIEADTIDADKYFHCKANYEAAERGQVSSFIADALSMGREIYGQVIKNDPLTDMVEDQKANRYGRKAARSGKYKSASEACATFRPKALDEKY
ncbi:MAG: hypothetical protein KDI46_01735 [Alphaproteobacteria bacterium]|nr:hypothetical protein [Alphaproteobacteria bacterium]